MAELIFVYWYQSVADDQVDFLMHQRDMWSLGHGKASFVDVILPASVASTSLSLLLENRNQSTLVFPKVWLLKVQTKLQWTAELRLLEWMLKQEAGPCSSASMIMMLVRLSPWIG